jgi:hypothetical protein
MADGDVDYTDVPEWLAKLLSAAPLLRRPQPTDGPDGEVGAQALRPLGSMTKSELIAEAERRGIEVDPGATKAKIREVIEAKIPEQTVVPARLDVARAAPDWRSFVGYYGGVFEHGNRKWCRLYLDMDLQSSLIIESDGVLERENIQNEVGVAPGRVVLWVRPDAAVGHGKRSLSREGEFLTGAFTRAGDIDLGTAGGTPDAATGLFCDARSVGCCMGRTNRPPR